MAPRTLALHRGIPSNRRVAAARRRAIALARSVPSRVSNLRSTFSRPLTTNTVKPRFRGVDDVRVLTDSAAVEAALDSVRASILGALTEPGSATTVATAIGLSRQKV